MACPYCYKEDKDIMSGRIYIQFGKRALDLVLTVPALIVFAPLLALVALLVRLKLGSPVLFRQQRPGRHGRLLTLFKFRTMTDACDAEGRLLPDAQRLTPFGRFLRRTSLDELPELFNVLKGEMSLVGPRPLLIKYQPYYSQQELRRFEVLPGISGWAQVNGRNNMAWDDRLASDLWYVDNASLLLDLKILCLTLWKVVRRDNVQVDPRATMLDFDEERKLRAAQDHVSPH